MKRQMKTIFCFKTVIALTLAFTMLMGVSLTLAEPWKFGVMADTQWLNYDDGRNPNTVAVEIIKQLNQKFIDAGVEFVVQVGDLTDKGDRASYKFCITPSCNTSNPSVCS